MQGLLDLQHSVTEQSGYEPRNPRAETEAGSQVGPEIV